MDNRGRSNGYVGEGDTGYRGERPIKEVWIVGEVVRGNCSGRVGPVGDLEWKLGSAHALFEPGLIDPGSITLYL